MAYFKVLWPNFEGGSLKKQQQQHTYKQYARKIVNASKINRQNIKQNKQKNRF